MTEHSRIIVKGPNQSGILPYEVVWKPTLITNELVRRTLSEANTDRECAGVITWMHIFLPAKPRILGLQEFRRPLIHFHTQSNREIPYDTIGMDFVDENQFAHGDREYGHMVTHMDIERKVIVEHQSDEKVIGRIAGWMRVTMEIMESSHVRVVKFADNMRDVAVTEGDKVETQVKFDWEMDAYPINELCQCVKAVPKGDATALVDEYYSKYTILLEGRDPGEFKRHVTVQVRIETRLERLLVGKDYHATMAHFGGLGGLQQLPSLAIQGLMKKGYGFGGEEDWKTAAMVRLMKTMAQGVKNVKDTPFMEDYTYDLVLDKEGILETHMLEVYPSIADGEISIKVSPLSTGDREDPARLVFTSKTGHGITTSLANPGTRFCLTISNIEYRKTEKAVSKLPVTTAFRVPESSLATGAEARILAGGAYHTTFSYDLMAEQMGDWAESMGIEVVYIDKDITIRGPKNEIRWDGAVYR